MARFWPLLRLLAAHPAAIIPHLAENVLGPHPRHFERAAHYTGLTTAQIKSLAERYNAAQMAVLEEIAAEAEALKARAPSGASGKFRAGGYFYSSTGETPDD